MLSAASVPCLDWKSFTERPLRTTRTAAFYLFAVLADSQPAQVDARQCLIGRALVLLGQFFNGRRQRNLHPPAAGPIAGQVVKQLVGRGVGRQSSHDRIPHA